MKKHNFSGIFLRSFLLQSVWNFERMQNVGFLFAVQPALKNIYKDKTQRLAAFKSHNGFFNTHPYMANIIIGLVTALEEEKSSGKISENEVQSLKSSLSGPLAAIGDTFFWATWRPFCALALVSVMLIYGKFMSGFAALASLAAYLIVYNSLHFTVRFAGLTRAYKIKTKIIKTITEINTQKMTDIIRIAGTIVIWSTVILYFLLNLNGITSRVFFAVIFFLAAVFTIRGVSSTKLFYFTIASVFVLKFAIELYL